MQAAFIRSDSPAVWLQYLGEWGVKLSALECYRVPQSIQSTKSIGLFVIFKEEVSFEYSAIVYPYRMEGKGLYIPIDAKVFPPLLPEEWAKVLLHDRQFFHPTIGLVGFSLQDKVDLGDLLVLPELTQQSWDMAQIGKPKRPSLLAISVDRPPIQDFIDELKKDINPLPLDEIPRDPGEKSSSLQEEIDQLKRFLLKQFLKATEKDKDRKDKPQGDRSSKSDRVGHYPNSGTGGGVLSGLWGKAEQWLGDRLADLEKRREREVERLLKLFDEDPDQALRYSIPLGGPYQSRGAAPPSDRLGSRNTDFNLGGLGGGRKADFWQLDKYYASLRERYQKAAKERLEQGDYRKAAYIYAQLLGDFHSAASALEQGKYYREAAILYKDHLKQLPKAAKCLEEGGLLLEAIPLYKELGKNEKVGDLYEQLDQGEQAAIAYERAVNQYLELDNYLAASRIYEEKLDAPAALEALLLKGWQSSKQAEDCLGKYFVVKQERSEVDLSEVIQAVYQKSVPANKKTSFLHVLMRLKRKTPEVQACSREIAYEIISENAVKGKLEDLSYLKHFVEEDTLLGKDTSKYLFHNKKRPGRYGDHTTELKLDGRVAWESSIDYRNQLLVFGRREKRLVIARVNWKGTISYYSSDIPLSDDITFHFLEPIKQEEKLIIFTRQNHSISPIVLPRNSYFFHSIEITFLDWLPATAVGISWIKSNRIAVLTHEIGLQLKEYDLTGAIHSTIDCHQNDQALVLQAKGELQTMYFRDKCFYVKFGGYLLRISLQGALEIHLANASITAFQFSPPATAKRLIYVANKRVTYMRPTFKAIDENKMMLRNNVRNVKQIAFLVGRKVLISDTDSGEVYDLKYHQVLKRYSTNKPIIGVSAWGSRRTFAVIEASGFIKIYDIPTNP